MKPGIKVTRRAPTVGRIKGLRVVVNRLRTVPFAAVRDDGIRRHIERGLSRNPAVDPRSLSIEVTRGVVHVRGTIRTPVQRRIIEDEAWSAPGMRGLVSELEVVPARPRNEVQVTGEILQGLSQCLGIDLSEVRVVVKEGVACLRGMVPSDHLRSAAEDLARLTPEVTEVRNELQVSPRLGGMLASTS
ncbi:MAG: BON domain-containing protein [Chloroflexi bacterium]|nr:BON domain-containing protein [Chloroflexota bacterium]